jgi:hypothetical protein
MEHYNAPTDAMTWPAPLVAGPISRGDRRVDE